MMKKTFYTPTGEEYRELTPTELEFFANSGCEDATKEKLKSTLKTASNADDKITAILEFLGV